MKTLIIRVKLTQEEDGRWSVLVPDLPGCYTWADTREQALANIQEAAALYIETLKDDGLPIPPGVIVTDEPTIAITVPAA